MRKNIQIALACFVVLTLVVPIVDAQLSAEYADWADGPEGFLLTKKEIKEWGKIKSDAEAERFIELFWARRNPQPNNPFNTFKAEFDAKVKFADDNFGYKTQRGSLTDRGRVLILMGRPAGRDIRGTGEVPSAGATSDSDQVRGRTDLWFYDPEKLPEEFKAKGNQLIFMFYEERLDSNIFVLDRSNRESFKAMSALARAPEVYLLHPDLTEVPKPISISGAAPAAAAHLAWLDVDDAPFDDVAITFSDLGVANDVSRPVWVHLELPPDAPPLDVIVGQVKSSEDEIVSNFETNVTPIDGQYGSVYHLAFPLENGAYTIEIAGGAGGEPQLVKSFETEVSPIPTDGVWMSPLWVGISATPNREAKLGEAFTFGGWHLMPVAGPELTKAMELAYFGFVVRPELNEEGKVDLEARVQLKRDGKNLGRALKVPLDTSNIIGDLYMYGNSIGLSGLPEAGDYGFEFEVTERISETSVTKDLSIQINE